MNDCVFCKIIKGELPSKTLWSLTSNTKTTSSKYS